jgi:hypothetical protein
VSKKILGRGSNCKNSQDSAVANSQLSKSISDLSKSSAENARLATLNTQLQTKLLQQSGQIIDLSKQAIGSVTGGDSFAYCEFTFLGRSSGTLLVVSSDKYPLYDVRARVVDVNKFKQLVANNIPITLGNVSETIISVGDMSSPSTSIERTIPFTGTDSQDFNIFFSGRNGF